MTWSEFWFLVSHMLSPASNVFLVAALGMWSVVEERNGRRVRAYLLFGACLVGCLAVAFFLAGGLMCLSLHP